jgi:hypothetical protein
VFTAKRRVRRASGVERMVWRLVMPALRMRMVGAPWVERRVALAVVMEEGEARSTGI